MEFNKLHSRTFSVLKARSAGMEFSSKKQKLPEAATQIVFFAIRVHMEQMKKV